MIEKIKGILKKGFLHIFSATFLNKIIQFGITMVLVRILSKKLYGNLSAAQNILNLFLILQGIGASPSILQFCSASDSDETRRSYFKFGLRLGVLFNLVVSILILMSSIIFKFPIEGSRPILLSLFLIPVFSIIYDIFQTYLRASLQNRAYSFLSTTNSILYLLGSVILGILLSIKGVVTSMYLAYVLSCIIGAIILKEELKETRRAKLPSRERQKEFLKFSVTSSVTNAISQILYIIDTFLIGLIVATSDAVASYKTATLIPFNMTFIPLSIMIFIYPYFAKHSDDKKWIKVKYNQLQKYLIILNGVISLVLIVFAPIIIKIIFGEQYMDSVTPFRILSLGYFISGSFRIPGGNILFSIKKVKVNFYNSVISGIANIILDVILIKYYGSNGAAIATLVVFIISSIISNIYIYKYLGRGKEKRVV